MAIAQYSYNLLVYILAILNLSSSLSSYFPSHLCISSVSDPQADPLNGAIGFFPGSHLLRGDLFGRKAEEMVGASAPGSVILYDSFTEHRGLENQSLWKRREGRGALLRFTMLEAATKVGERKEDELQKIGLTTASGALFEEHPEYFTMLVPS